MPDEPQYPSKWLIAVVFLVIVLMIVGVFAWAFWLNVGTVTVKGDQAFTLDANGQTHDCTSKECVLTLPPRSYQMAAHSPGDYDETFSIDVTRWSDQTKDLHFRVIPYLKPVELKDIPELVPAKAHFTKEKDGAMNLVLDQDKGSKIITTFGSLKEPKVQIVDDLAVVTDQGRVFFVSVSDGRKLRRFDDSVTVKDAVLSDDAKKILFFVNSQGVDAIWLWFNDTKEMSPLSWYAASGFVQWERGVNSRLFVVSNQLMPTQQTSTLDKVINSVQTAQQQYGLFQVNLETQEVIQLSSFDQTRVPLDLIRRGDRYFVEYAGGVFDELVVQ